MVQGIIIAADNTTCLRTGMLDSLEDYMRAVGGWIGAVDIPSLGVTMYVRGRTHPRSAVQPASDVPMAIPRSAGPRRPPRLRRRVVGLTDNDGENTELPMDF